MTCIIEKNQNFIYLNVFSQFLFIKYSFTINLISLKSLSTVNKIMRTVRTIRIGSLKKNF